MLMGIRVKEPAFRVKRNVGDFRSGGKSRSRRMMACRAAPANGTEEKGRMVLQSWKALWPAVIMISRMQVNPRRITRSSTVHERISDSEKRVLKRQNPLPIFPLQAPNRVC
jgi:hypothetical protein